MKSIMKTVYEEPKLQVISFCAQDILTSSSDAFLGEDDMLGNEEPNGNSLW